MEAVVRRAEWTGPAAAALGTVGGVYLMFAPAWLGYVGGAEAVSQRIVGPIIAVFWIVAAWDVTRSVRWWTVPFGVWLLLEPLVLAGPAGAKASAAVVGVLTVVLAWAAHDGRVAERYSGGWKGLWRSGGASGGP